MNCGKKWETNKCHKYCFDNTKYSEHFVCDKCDENINKNEPISLFCIICDKEHEQNKNKIIDNTDKCNENINDENINKDKKEANNINKDENVKNSSKKNIIIKIDNESNNIYCKEPYNNNNNTKNSNSINQKIQNRNNNKNDNINKRPSKINSKIYESTPIPNIQNFSIEENEESQPTRRREEKTKCCIIF